MNAIAAYRGPVSNRPLALLLGGEFVSAIGDWLYALKGADFLELVGRSGAIQGRLPGLYSSNPGLNMR
jgi:hypothetical protein